MTFLARLFVLILMALPLPAAAIDRGRIETMFGEWRDGDIWPEAKARGVSREAFERAFAGVTLDWELPDLVPPGTKPPKAKKQSQAEFSAPAAYFSEKRLAGLAAAGRARAKTHARLLARIEKTYGVPAEIVVAIWGRETGYGAAKIPHSAIRVLATKAFMSTRKDLFRKELIAALEMVDQGVDPKTMRGSWAGAMGQPQFMPTSYLNHAVDFDGDGVKDIWGSVDDSLASIAAYLVNKGWQPGRGWGYEVSIPEGVSCAQEGPDKGRPLSDWAGTGIVRISGKPFPKAEMKATSMMLVPAGTHGPEFIVSPNFYVLKEYNNSDLYALFIGNLADRIATGAGAFKAPWGDVGKMLRSDIEAMQKRLKAEGHDVGKVDGLPGFKTRRSIGLWQAEAGLSPTCFPDEGLLKRIR